MKKEKIKVILKRLRKVLGLRTLIILIVLLSFNTYAWFVFTNRVDTGLGAKVKSWNIKFRIDDEVYSENLNFEIDDLYPGMDNYLEEVSIVNDGDTNAIVSFELVEVRIFDTIYTVSNSLTSETLVNWLKNNYPFVVDLALSKTEIEPDGTASFSVSANWDFESNDDIVDTQWGERAYAFNHSNPTLSSISIDLILKIDQKNT